MARSTAGTPVKTLAIFCLLAFVAVSPDGVEATYGVGGNYTGFGLKNNFYGKTCRNAESLVTAAVKAAFAADNSIVGGLIRLFFHDCFVRVSVFAHRPVS